MLKNNLKKGQKSIENAKNHISLVSGNLLIASSINNDLLSSVILSLVSVPDIYLCCFSSVSQNFSSWISSFTFFFETFRARWGCRKDLWHIFNLVITWQSIQDQVQRPFTLPIELRGKYFSKFGIIWEIFGKVLRSCNKFSQKVNFFVKFDQN